MSNGTNPNFGSILNRPSSEAERPPAAPAGQYLAIIKGLPEQGKSQKNQTEFIRYVVQPVNAIDGTVDEEELGEFVEKNGPLTDTTWPLTFYMTEKSAFRHKEFLNDDLQMEDDGGTHWERAQQAPGHQFVLTMQKRPTQDGKGFFNDIVSTAPVAE